MFNPAYVLPTFLGVCCAGLVIWNVRMTGDVDKLDKKLEIAESDNDTLKECVEELNRRYQSAQTAIKGYQQDVDTLREERRIQEVYIDSFLQVISDQEKTIKDFTGMINTLNNKIPKRDESGKFKKKK